MMRFIPATGRKLSIPSTPTRGRPHRKHLPDGLWGWMKELPQFVEGWHKRCGSRWAK
jgi:hypothetical protein